MTTKAIITKTYSYSHNKYIHYLDNVFLPGSLLYQTISVTIKFSEKATVMFQLYLICPLFVVFSGKCFVDHTYNAGCHTYGGNCFYEVVQLESKQYAGLARVVQTQNHHSHLHLGPYVDSVVLLKQRTEERRGGVKYHTTEGSTY